MKSTAVLFLASCIIFFSTGCDKLKEKRYSTTIPYEFVVEITSDDTTVIDMTGELTSMINTELEKVKDKIKRYELVSMEYKIWEFYGEQPNTFTGTMGFGNANANSAGVIHQFSGIDLKSGNDNPDRVEMNLNSQDIERLQQYFLDTNGLRMFFAGNVDQKPVHFKMQVVVNIDAIAESKK
jgi:hypothetical protein